MIIRPFLRRPQLHRLGRFATGRSAALFLASIALGAGPARSQTPAEPTADRVVVTSKLDEDRNQIVPSLGATEYRISRNQIDAQSQGVNAPFNQVILRAPGVAGDSFGQLHVRGEHANLQYRINDVLLPEGISGFGQELDPRFLASVSLINGSLPAQFGFRTAGIVDIQTKTGTEAKGGELSLYGGSFDTLRTSFASSGSAGKWSYFLTGSYFHSALGIESPTGSSRPIHDDTDQAKGFGYASYLIDSTSRISLFLSASVSSFQIPNSPGQEAAFGLTGVPSFDSAKLNERQFEKNYYVILAYQKSWSNLNLQLAAFGRYSKTLFKPDPIGDLVFNGVASQVDRSIGSTGFQADASYTLNDQNTLRAGAIVTVERARAKSFVSVFPADDTGAQASTDPFTIVDGSRKTGVFYGLYLQDEWKPFRNFTVNFGARFDVVSAYVNETQLSPRVNVTYELSPATTLHAGYARYFTPPPLELVKNETLGKFVGTTNQPEVFDNSPVKSERSHYFDLGITQKVLPGWEIGVDGYYKIARNQLDDGQFGQALILSPFNYRKGKVYGVEVTSTYQNGGFSAYANFAFSKAQGKDLVSGQFLFARDELDYIRNHAVFLDHDQTYTISAGVSYKLNETRVSADLLFGSGLRRGFANTEKLPAYYPVNLGVEQGFKVPGVGKFKARFDVVNVFNQIFQLRDGSGIGVGAAQFGAHRGFYGGIAYEFGGTKAVARPGK